MNLLKTMFLLVCLSISFLANAQQNNSRKEKEKLMALLYYIEKFYVEDVNQHELIENAIKNILNDLDPHSTYVAKEKVEDANEPLKGNFEGVGIQFNILNDTIFVVAPITGGPSERVGLLAGDKIITIDGETVAGIKITNKGVAKRLRGKKGTEVKVQIKRTGEKKLLDFTITRDKIPLFSLNAKYMVNDSIGYIKVTRFASTTTDELRTAIIELKAKGMKSLILDLESNGGGYLKSAFGMADEFLDLNKMIVYTEGKHSPRKDLRATSIGNFHKGKLIVLVDQYSASASEIVSGAVQDWDRGLVVGRRTFGKGLVQRMFNLPDTSQIRLTVAEYFTPSGRFIQKPYKNSSVADYKKELIHRYETGELTDSMKTAYPDSLKFLTNAGRTVYGGGGITPDVFVAIDTNQNSQYFWDVIRKGTINKFTLEYVDKNRKKLKRYYQNQIIFDKNFSIDDEFLQDFVNFARKEKVEENKADIEKSKKALSVRLKALIARNLYGEEAYYYIINKELNTVFKKAVQILEQNEYTKILSNE